MNDIQKDVGKIWSRLFDHKAFLNGEIHFTLNEFEKKRGEREVESLFSTLENVTDVKDTQIGRLKQSADVALPEINVNLSQILSYCNRISDLQLKYTEDTTLELNRENRKIEWDKFVDDMSHKRLQIDKTFEEKETE